MVTRRLLLLSSLPLPPKIPELVGGSASDRFRQLFEVWIIIGNVYSYDLDTICIGLPGGLSCSFIEESNSEWTATTPEGDLHESSNHDCSNFSKLAKDWLELFLSLRKHYEGFEPKHVIPYMHIMVYHVPEMVQRLGSIKQFSGQGKH